MPILQVVDTLVSSKNITETLDIDSLITKLVDALALMSVCNSDRNSCRRDTIKKDLNDDYQAI